MIIKEKENVRDIKIADVPGLAKRGDAIISTDAEALNAYKKRKAFYRDFAVTQKNVERLIARVDDLENQLRMLKGN